MLYQYIKNRFSSYKKVRKKKRRKGLVRWINHCHNRGIIKVKNTKMNAIVQLSDTTENIKPGDAVVFTLEKQKNRYIAKDVSLI